MFGYPNLLGTVLPRAVYSFGGFTNQSAPAPGTAYNYTGAVAEYEGGVVKQKAANIGQRSHSTAAHISANMYIFGGLFSDSTANADGTTASGSRYIHPEYYLTSITKYDGDTTVSASSSLLPQGVYSAEAVELNNNIFVFSGTYLFPAPGFPGSEYAYNKTQKFNETSNVALLDMAYASTYGGSPGAAKLGNNIYIFYGDSTSQKCNGNSIAFVTSPLPMPQAANCQASSLDGKIYVFSIIPSSTTQPGNIVTPAYSTFKVFDGNTVTTLGNLGDVISNTKHASNDEGVIMFGASSVKVFDRAAISTRANCDYYAGRAVASFAK